MHTCDHPIPPSFCNCVDFTDCSGTLEHDDIHEAQFWEQVQRVHLMLNNLPDSTVLAGESQGGTVALWAALTYPARPVTVLAIRTVLLPLNSPFLRIHTPNIYVFAARNDEVFPLALQRKSLSCVSCKWHVQNHIGHSDSCNAVWQWAQRICTHAHG